MSAADNDKRTAVRVGQAFGQMLRDALVTLSETTPYSPVVEREILEVALLFAASIMTASPSFDASCADDASDDELGIRAERMIAAAISAMQAAAQDPAVQLASDGQVAP